MAGIPVRLSAQLATRAKEAAQIQDRSLTEQVEHWARLGEAVEAATSASTVALLKAASYGQSIDDALSFARSPEGRAHAKVVIERDNPVRYEQSGGKITKLTARARKKR